MVNEYYRTLVDLPFDNYPFYILENPYGKFNYFGNKESFIDFLSKIDINDVPMGKSFVIPGFINEKGEYDDEIPVRSLTGYWVEEPYHYGSGSCDHWHFAYETIAEVVKAGSLKPFWKDGGPEPDTRTEAEKSITQDEEEAITSHGDCSMVYAGVNSKHPGWIDQFRTGGQLPAYATIYNTHGLYLGKLNITTDRPKTPEDVLEHIENDEEPRFNLKIKQYIFEFVNSMRPIDTDHKEDSGKTYMWYIIRFLWASLHPYQNPPDINTEDKTVEK